MRLSRCTAINVLPAPVAKGVIDAPLSAFARFALYDVNGTRCLFPLNFVLAPTPLMQRGINQLGSRIGFVIKFFHDWISFGFRIVLEKDGERIPVA